MTVLCPDSWLGARLGKPAFGAGPRLEAHDLPQGPAFISAKVDVSDIPGLLHLQDLGFRVMDTNLQMTRSAAPLPFASEDVRFARPGDEEGVRAIASDTFSHDRFHRDPKIPEATAARIKADWTGNFFSGQRGDWMVVAEAEGFPQAFLQLIRGKDGAIVIDLVAVSRRYQRKGLARAMIGFAAEACLGQAAAMKVGTQIANIPSLTLYIGLGFRIASASYVLHLHR